MLEYLHGADLFSRLWTFLEICDTVASAEPGSSARSLSVRNIVVGDDGRPHLPNVQWKQQSAVRSLGIILCEIVTGRPALSPAGGKRWPSRELRGIAARAINEQRQPHVDQYRSVTELTKDVLRFLNRYVNAPSACP